MPPQSWTKWRANFRARHGISYTKFRRLAIAHPEETAAKLRRMKKRQRVKFTGGISKVHQARGGVVWAAYLRFGMVRKQRVFSVRKLGDQAAKLAATLQRMCWLVESGLWKPDEGNPLAILSYSDMFKGNAEYADSVVDGESSPWVPE